MKRNTYILIFFLSCILFALPALAKEPKPLLAGHAQITLKIKKHTLRFDQAIRIETADQARFEALDDFGNSFFKIAFTPEGIQFESQGNEQSLSDAQFAKLVRLKLTREEFIQILLGKSPEGKIPKKRVVVHYPDAKTIEILSGKTFFQLIWKEVERKN